MIGLIGQPLDTITAGSKPEPVEHRIMDSGYRPFRNGEMRRPEDLDSALAAATQAGIDAIYAVSSRHMVARATRIVDFATKNRLPLVGGWGAWVQVGGLISYGPNVDDMIRFTALYVDKFFKGAKPGDLPVQQPTRFELLINLKAAKALGIDVPPLLLSRADKVIK